MPRSKKDIDKELMYKKLLPTSAAAEQRKKLPPELFSPSNDFEQQLSPPTDELADIGELPSIDSLPTIEEAARPALAQQEAPMLDVEPGLPPLPQQAVPEPPQPSFMNAPPVSSGSISLSIDSPVQVHISNLTPGESPAPDNAPCAPPCEWQEAPAPYPAFSQPDVCFEPHNLMEDLVAARLEEAMMKFKCCMCEKCRKDITALALNHLKPFYVIEEDPAARILNERERAAEVATALVRAILTVKSNPSH